MMRRNTKNIPRASLEAKYFSGVKRPDLPEPESPTTRIRRPKRIRSLSASSPCSERFPVTAHEPQRESPSAEHPVIRTHPVTGKRLLFVNRGFTRQIKGLSRTESRALLDFLFEHVAHPRFQCRLSWEKDSVAIWDNRCTQHLAVWDYYPETRSGIRVTVQGDRPQH